MTFHVGQKVVCVDAGGLDRLYVLGVDGRIVHEPYCSLRLGEIYTISAIFPHHLRGHSVATLLETERPPGLGYRLARFRPVVERKTDISIFTEMLGPQRELERAFTSHKHGDE